MIFTGLGVFRLYFDFDWTAGKTDSGQLFALRMRGGQSFNLFEAEPFGRVFWFSQLATLCMTILMPMFRLIGGSIIALITVAVLVALHLNFSTAAAQIPLEFQLLIVLVLYGSYVLLNYIGEVRDRKRFDRLLSQYVPAELAAEYRRDPDVMKLRGEEREISVLFCDVVGFSAISEKLEPAELNLFFTHVSRIVVRHRGSIDKYMGDTVMAVWGAPARSESHAFDALSAALDIQAEIEVLNKKYRDKRLPEVSMAIGISTGPAMVGPLGSDYRMDYTVVGDTVNIAQRLEEQTRKYQVSIIVSDNTTEALPDMRFRELDTVMVKGRIQPVTMYEPMGPADQLSDVMQHWLELHELAMQASKEGKWDTAESYFLQLREEWGPADMYDLYLAGITQARQH